MLSRSATSLLPTFLMTFSLASAFSGCAMTSPDWDYEPESITAPILFQGWSLDATTPVQVQCASDTLGHGNPTDGEASYVRVADLEVDATEFSDRHGTIIHSVSDRLVLPSICWKHFSSYGFWQANVRMVQVMPQHAGGSREVFTSFDQRGLRCLREETVRNGSWLAFRGRCEKRYTNTGERIPYVVLRVHEPPP